MAAAAVAGARLSVQPAIVALPGLCAAPLGILRVLSAIEKGVSASNAPLDAVVETAAFPHDAVVACCPLLPQHSLHDAAAQVADTLRTIKPRVSGGWNHLPTNTPVRGEQGGAGVGGAGGVHFVTHGAGALVLREAFRQVDWEGIPSACVMIAPPNRGFGNRHSHLRMWLERSAFFKSLPEADASAEEWDSAFAPLPASLRVLVVAGVSCAASARSHEGAVWQRMWSSLRGAMRPQSQRATVSPMLDSSSAFDERRRVISGRDPVWERSDGLLTVAETTLPTPHELALVSGSHLTLPWLGRTAHIASRFIGGSA